MNDAKDIVTATLPGIPEAPAPEPAEPVGRAGKKHQNRAAKQKAYREAHGLRAMTVMLPVETADQLDAWLTAKKKNKSATIAKLIETQLLRKR